jgi:hypothetical protein
MSFPDLYFDINFICCNFELRIMVMLGNFDGGVVGPL